MGSTPHRGLGSDMFDSVSPLCSAGTIMSQCTACDEEHIDNDGDDVSTWSSVSSVVVALASATLEDSSWQFAPSYPPQYLSTISEYLPPPQKAPAERTAGAAPDDCDDQESHPWATEKYESSMHTDHIFDSFNDRTAHEPQQCVRWAPSLLRWSLTTFLIGATCVGTTLAGYLCHLRQMAYTNSYSYYRQINLG
jgi:pre-rRNA-processing protein TSR4